MLSPWGSSSDDREGVVRGPVSPNGPFGGEGEGPSGAGEGPGCWGDSVDVGRLAACESIGAEAFDAMGAPGVVTETRYASK